jgi:putative transposase
MVIFTNGYDLQNYTKGANKELGLNFATVQMIGHEYATKRKQFKKSRLNWRKSNGVKRSLGWMQVRKDCISFKDGCVYHNRNHFKIWDSYGLDEYTFKSGSFNEGARDSWYFNVVVDVDTTQSIGKESIGIDLGRKEAATDSNGDGVKAIHAKIKNRRSDDLHQYSRKLVNNNAAIFVGNINSKAMIKTKMAKSALDAGWGILKTMLGYKCDHAGIVLKKLTKHTTPKLVRVADHASTVRKVDLV